MIIISYNSTIEVQELINSYLLNSDNHIFIIDYCGAIMGCDLPLNTRRIASYELNDIDELVNDISSSIIEDCYIIEGEYTSEFPQLIKEIKNEISRVANCRFLIIGTDDIINRIINFRWR